MKKENYIFTYEELFIIQHLYNSKNFQVHIENIKNYSNLTNIGFIKTYSGNRGSSISTLTSKGIDYYSSHITYFEEVLSERLG